MTNESIYRILDAASNRASEGLRVVEDFVRMVLDDFHLTEKLKLLRHQLTPLISELSAQERIAARDTLGDVGTTATTPSEFNRQNCQDVLHANLARVQQSLRTLEEYSKTISQQAAQGFEQLRYQSYQLEKAILTTLWSQDNLQNARLYGLTDGAETPAEFRLRMTQWVSAGIPLIQLRDKRLNDRELLLRAEILNELCRDTSTRWIMNDRTDLAAAGRAHGVHLGQDDLPVREARRILGPARLIGVSTHSIEQARQAVLEGANYIGVGPTFVSGTKSFEELAGLELVRQIAQEIALPAFAIGGITLDNLSHVKHSGLRRVAVSAALSQAPHPTEAIQAFLAELDSERC